MANKTPGAGTDAKKNSKKSSTGVAPKSPIVDKKANKLAPKQNSSNKTAKQAPKANKQSPKKDGIFKKITTYFKNVRLEVKRTTWPTRDEVIRMSLIVLGALLFFGVFIFLMDQLMGWLLGQYSNLSVDPTVPIDGTIDPGIDVTGGDAAGDITGGGGDTTGAGGADGASTDTNSAQTDTGEATE